MQGFLFDTAEPSVSHSLRLLRGAASVADRCDAAPVRRFAPGRIEPVGHVVALP